MATATKQYNKKPDLKTKSGQLWLAQRKGLRDSEAARRIGVSPKNVPELENTRTYEAIKTKYGDALKSKITLDEMATEQIKNIKQDRDLGAKNMAIKMAKEYIEPETELRDIEMVNVVIKKD